jgi:1-deoxy-D-xylulose-5-phosphate reductoisomerase
MIILGSTGSIGVNTLFIAKKYNLDIDVLVAGYNAELLNKQIKEFNPTIVVVANKDVASKIKHNNVSFGNNAIIEAIVKSKSTLVVNALVGFLGLIPTIESIKNGKKVALANKESLVIAGKFVDMNKIIPIDSEHFALSYIADNKKNIRKMFITASGGALRDFPLDKINNASVKDVLAHPNWSMGNKITVDSASMCNKIFELVEAKWLFGISQLDALIEPTSTMHGLVEYSDGSLVAHFARNDMKLPIAYALLPQVDDLLLPRVDLLALSKMNFKEIKSDRYPLWDIKNNILDNLDLGVVLNRANEEAVYRFLDNKISFGDISIIIKKSLIKFSNIKISSLEDIYRIDKEVKQYVKMDCI